MISRTHGVALATLLGAASVAGAYATITTAHLGDSETKPEVVASAAIAKRHARLDAWEASLRKALASRPPALPAVPRYARVELVGTPSYGALPALTTTGVAAAAAAPAAAAPARAAPRAVPVSHRQAPARTTRPRPAPRSTRSEADASEAVEKAPAETTPAVPSTPAPAPAPETTPAPAPAAAPLAQPAPTRLTRAEAERQCETLKRAAEAQGEAAKREAERQCERLKDAAEGQG